jgi:RES domain-containing protein
LTVYIEPASSVATVRIFRILHRKYASEPFSGKGGLVASSRWASAGQLVSYAAESLALATLEKIAGAGQMSRLTELVYVVGALDEEAVHTPPTSALPAGWDRRPPGGASRDFGDRWLRDRTSVALRVPSVVVPDGWNYVINPAHPAFADHLSHEESTPLELDPRILERLS